MKFNKKLKKGFTLVELIVVIAIVAILAAVSVVSYLAFINSANESADIQLVKQLNVALQSDESLNGTRDTMHEMLGAMVDNGFVVENLTKTKSGYDIVWDQEHNRFGLLNGEALVYGESTYNSAKAWNIWKFADIEGEAENKSYSVYLTEEFAKTGVTELDIKAGLDVGNNVISTINYVNDDEHPQTVVIRTNSAATNLNIDDESVGSIYHYGSAGALNIIQCHTASYHENGKVAYAEISKGRIVLEKGSDVEEIHINKKENEQAFDTVIIANNGGGDELPERITRDAVTVSEETLVVTVESNGSSENVYVYANGDTGSTQKVTEGENKQNEDVNSALGQLVLDNGSAGEKAQTAEEKEAAKQEAVQEAVIEEIEEDDKYVARIGTTPFESLKDAVAGALVNDVIEMTANDLSTENISIDKKITINMNEKTFGGTFVVATSNNTPVTINGTANVDAVLNNDNKYYPNLYVGASGSYHLLKDFTMTGTTITYGRNYVLDLGGHTLTMTYGGSDGAFEVKKDIYDGVGKLTIRNGNLNFTSTSSSANAFEVYGELTLDSVNVNSSCGNAAIKGEGGTYSQNCAITITNSVINSAGHGIYLMSYKSWSGSYISTLSISGSTINASNIGLYANGATCTVENTTIESSGSHAIQTVSSSPASGLAANVTISGTSSLTAQSANTIDCKSGTMQISGNVSVSGTNRCIYVQSSSLTIAGGTYLGNFGLGSSGQLTIAGGTFNGNLIDVTQAGRLLVIGETQFEELVTYSITGSNGSYEVVAQ